MEAVQIRKLADQATARLLSKDGTASSNRGGWLMIFTIFVEAWDLYAISFVLPLISADFKVSDAEKGLLTAAVQGGALVGCLIGGYVADRLGRKRVFIGTMAAFVVLAGIQGLSPNVGILMLIRFLMGIPLGSDIANGYAYIMESMPKGKREVMGSRWQAMFGVGEVVVSIAVIILSVAGLSDPSLWRVALSLGAIPALILLLARLNLPETPLSLLHRGKFNEAKQVSKQLFDDDLEMLPNEDVEIDRVHVGDFLKVIWADPLKKRATIFGWISNACQGAEFAGYAFYLPTITAAIGFSSFEGRTAIQGGIYVIAAISGFVAPLMLSKIGHRGVSMWGFGMAFVSLIISAYALHASLTWLVLLMAATLMWGHYWDASNGMTIVSMVAPPRFKGTASGFGYIFVKAASFFAAFVFPILTTALGKPGATLAVSVISLIGFLAAKFILPEVYGYVEREELEAAKAAGVEPAAGAH